MQMSGTTDLLLTLQNITRLPYETLAAWFTLNPVALIDAPSYQDAVGSLDTALLQRSYAEAHKAYESVLPAFQQEMETRYGYDHAPMFSTSLGKWLISVAERPHYMPQVFSLHASVPPMIIQETLPLLLRTMDHIGAGRDEWQRALALLSLPMMLPR